MIKKFVKLIKNPNKFFVYLAYKGRFNKMQDEKYLKKLYKGITGKKLNISNPKTFNEKLQWLKIHDRKSIYTTMVDKYLVRNYIAEKIGEKYLIPLIDVWDSADDINFDKLPDQFVLKCNHNSGLGMCICKDKSNLNIEKTRKELTRGLQQDYYLTGREWPYKHVPRKIIAEKYMVDDSGVELKDYKVMCFGGTPKLIQIHRGRFDSHTQDFYDYKWNKQTFTQGLPLSEGIMEKPSFLEEMLELSKILSEGIPQARIDWYYSNNQLYFGEITLFDGSGFEMFDPEEWDYKLGELINIENI